MRPPSNPSELAARAAHAWFAVDRVPRDPATTAWKRAARMRQSIWRDLHGYPVGAEPYGGGHDATPVGSRLALQFAKETGANFVSPAVLAAVRARLGAPELHEMLRADRLWADLLSSMPLCFNLFGDLAGDQEQAARAVAAWWPDTPRGPVTTRFEHSPGRRDPLLLGNRSAFDVAFYVDTGCGKSAVIGVETKYHEHAARGKAPNGRALARCTEVTERSEAFQTDWRSRAIGTHLQQIWFDHLLMLAMLQHPEGRTSWGRFVLVYPSENPSFAQAASEYREVLRDATTFEARTIEELIGHETALATATRVALSDRYLAPAAALL